MVGDLNRTDLQLSKIHGLRLDVPYHMRVIVLIDLQQMFLDARGGRYFVASELRTSSVLWSMSQLPTTDDHESFYLYVPVHPMYCSCAAH